MSAASRSLGMGSRHQLIAADARAWAAAGINAVISGRSTQTCLIQLFNDLGMMSTTLLRRILVSLIAMY